MVHSDSSASALLPGDEPLVADLATWNKRLGLPPNSRVLRKEILSGRLRAIRFRPGANAKIYLDRADVEAWLNAARSRSVVSRR